MYVFTEKGIQNLGEQRRQKCCREDGGKKDGPLVC